MHEPPVPACFRGRAAAAAPPPSTAVGPRLTTSSYHTHLGLAALSWSRTVLGLNLRIDLRLSPAAAGGPIPDGSESPSPAADAGAEPIRLRVRPWLFWKRRGSKKFQATSSDQRRRTIEVTWDLSHARFPAGGGPEPAAGFFVAVTVDHEMLVAAGDMSDEAYRKTKAARPAHQSGPLLLSKREHVTLGVDSNSERTYTTAVTFEGRQRQISVKIGSAKEPSTSMSISVDETRLLNVKRLRWKFRGSEMVEIGYGGRVRISWDMHNWLFKPSEETPPAAAEQSEVAVFVFRFERDSSPEVHSEKQQLCRAPAAYCNWSESSSGGERGRRRKSLVKTGSSSSSSSVSSASSSTVMEWASVEEAELRSADGFSLLIYAWKS